MVGSDSHNTGPEHWSQKKKGKAGWAGPKHACGLCNRPVRRGQGAVKCGHGHWIHLQCAGYTAAQAWKVLREKREFRCKCKKARVQKWLEETNKQRQKCRQEKTTAKRVTEVKEQQKDKNIAPGEEEEDFVHHPGRDRKVMAGEEQQIREELRGSPYQSKEKTTETIGASEGRERDNEKQPRKAGGAARETMAGAGSQDTVGDIEVGQGVQLVGMKHGDLGGCRGIIEEVKDGKAQVLLVGGERRVRVNK